MPWWLCKVQGVVLKHEIAQWFPAACSQTAWPPSSTHVRPHLHVTAQYSRFHHFNNGLVWFIHHSLAVIDGELHIAGAASVVCQRVPLALNARIKPQESSLPASVMKNPLWTWKESPSREGAFLTTEKLWFLYMLRQPRTCFCILSPFYF